LQAVGTSGDVRRLSCGGLWFKHRRIHTEI
jgi:hypothetical protein